MFGIISNYKNLFVADFSTQEEKIIKIVFSEYPNFSVDGQIIYPFAKEVRTDDNIIVSNKQHVKKLNYYVNCFGFPKTVLESELEKQKLVMKEVKSLKKLRKI